VPLWACVTCDVAFLWEYYGMYYTRMLLVRLVIGKVR
jgi:hypothetical protein